MAEAARTDTPSTRDELRDASARIVEQAKRTVELTKLLSSRAATIEAAIERAAQLTERIEAVESRAAATLASLSSLITRAEALTLDSALARAQIESRRLHETGRAAEQAMRRLERSLDGAVAFTDRLIEEHEKLQGVPTDARPDAAVEPPGPSG